MTEQQQSEARARYNNAKAIVAPVLRMLCDQEPRSVCARWKRLQALPTAKLIELADRLVENAILTDGGIVFFPLAIEVNGEGQEFRRLEAV